MDAQTEVANWLKQIGDAEEREKQWRKDSTDAVDLYEGEKRQLNSFNILYSNTETLLPAIYNNPPRPSVRQRYQDDDALGKAVSETLRRGLEFFVDTPDSTYTPFDDLLEAAILGALVPGRGITRFRYHADYAESEKPAESAKVHDEEKENSDESDSAENVAKPGKQQGASYVAGEGVCGINWPHDRFCMGFARRWRDVPWIAYEHRMTFADLKGNFGQALAKEIPMYGKEGEPIDKERASEDRKGQPDTAVVYEIWHKEPKQILFIARDYRDKVLKKVDDPLGIPGFYDCPKPLQFMNRNTNLVPIVPYKLYEEQARELNRVTMRINKVIEAIKVRGFYNGQMKQIGDLMQRPENTVIPSEAAIPMMDAGGLDKHIWLMPIDKLIGVLQQLYLNREQVKQTIYEITGISDILRGSTVASETATAQNIKNQWGTLRLKRMQKLSQKYARDSLRLVGDIMSMLLGVETWQAMTRLPYPTVQQKQQAQQTVMQLQMQMAANPQAQQQLMQQAQQQQAVLQQIDWGQIQKALQDNLSRGFIVDVETNSTVDPDATEDKQNITDVLTAMSQVLQVFGPGIQAGLVPVSFIKELLLMIVRRFQFGPNLEDAIKKLPDQAPPQGDPQQQKQLQQLQQENQQLQQKMQQQELAMQEREGKVQLSIKEAQMQQDLQAKETQMEVKGAIREHQAAVKGQIKQAVVQDNAARQQHEAAVASTVQQGVAKQEASVAKQQAIATPQPEIVKLEQMMEMVVKQQQIMARAVNQLLQRGSKRKFAVQRGPDGSPIGVEMQ